MVMEKSGKSHGVFLLNSNAMGKLLVPLSAQTMNSFVIFRRYYPAASSGNHFQINWWHSWFLHFPWSNSRRSGLSVHGSHRHAISSSILGSWLSSVPFWLQDSEQNHGNFAKNHRCWNPHCNACSCFVNVWLILINFVGHSMEWFGLHAKGQWFHLGYWTLC